MLRLLPLSLLSVSASAFFFGGGGGGCGCAPAPLCLPMPMCAPAAPACGPSCSSAPVFPQAAPSYPAPSYAAPPPQPILPQSPIYQPQYQGPLPQGPTYANAPIAQGPIGQGPVESYGQIAPQNPQPQGAGYQGPAETAAQRDAEPSELVNRLQQEAAAAGQTNEEVIEEQDHALDKPDVAVFSTVSPLSSTAATTNDVAEERVVDVSSLNLTDDPLCNSEDLRKLMLENIDENLNSSKRLIQLAAEAQFGGRFDVICANGDFSYVTNTELFCQETKGDISCYTYRQL